MEKKGGGRKKKTGVKTRWKSRTESSRSGEGSSTWSGQATILAESFWLGSCSDARPWHGAPCLSSSAGLLCACVAGQRPEPGLSGWNVPGEKQLFHRARTAGPTGTHTYEHTRTHTHTHTHTHTYIVTTQHIGTHYLGSWQEGGKRAETLWELSLSSFLSFHSFVRSFFLALPLFHTYTHTHTHTNTQTHTPLFQCSLRSFGDCASGLCSPMMNDLPKNT